MHFADDDRFTHAEVIEDPAAIVEHNYWRDAARHHALTPENFIAEHGPMPFSTFVSLSP